MWPGGAPDRPASFSADQSQPRWAPRA